MSHDINSRLLMERKPRINIAIHAWLLLMLVTGRQAKHMLIMSARNELKNENFYAYENVSARNEHKNENFYAYENVMRL